jgi:hypothetical protein
LTDGDVSQGLRRLPRAASGRFERFHGDLDELITAAEYKEKSRGRPRRRKQLAEASMSAPVKFAPRHDTLE